MSPLFLISVESIGIILSFITLLNSNVNDQLLLISIVLPWSSSKIILIKLIFWSLIFVLNPSVFVYFSTSKLLTLIGTESMILLDAFPVLESIFLVVKLDLTYISLVPLKSIGFTI